MNENLHHKLDGLQNVDIITSPNYPFEKLLELKSVKRCLAICVDKLPQNEYNFVVFWGGRNDEHFLLAETTHLYSNAKGEQMLTGGGKKNVLLWIGDEFGIIPCDECFKRFHFVFKVHLRDKDAVWQATGVNRYRKGLYHLPLLTTDDVPQLPVLSAEERQYDVYFCGNLNANRYPLYLSLKTDISRIEKILGIVCKNRTKGHTRLFRLLGDKNGNLDFSERYANSYIKFYRGFNKGAGYNEYASLLQKSRIVLSPYGFCSPECFRFYEAMRQGCLVITEPLPHVDCYKDAPCITVRDWNDLREVLSDKELLQEFTPDEIKKYYDSNLSVEAIANYILGIIQKEKT